MGAGVGSHATPCFSAVSCPTEEPKASAEILNIELLKDQQMSGAITA
jgi:hypothetical protein